MEQGLLVFVGVLASVIFLMTLAGGVTTQLYGSNTGTRGLIDVIGGLLGATFWIVFALGSMNIQQYTMCCTYTYQNTALAYIGAAMAALSIILGLFGAVILIDVTDLKTPSGGGGR